MNNNIEIIRILNDKYYDYMFIYNIRSPIFLKIETRNFIKKKMLIIISV